MRCLTLARALTAQGVACAFAVGDAGAVLVDRFGAEFAVHRQGVGSALQTGAFETLVIDDYGAAAEQELEFRSRVGALVVIDDLANRPHRAALLIDPGYGREDADYAALLPKSARLLTGPDYALVDPSFRALRSAALGRSTAAEPKRLFMSFGLSDIGGVARRAVEAVRARYPDVVIDIALGSDAESAPALKAKAESDPALNPHFDALNIAELMAGADAAIGAGGASTWERACLGLPTVAVIVADNQRAMIQALAHDGALLAVDLGKDAFEREFNQALERLWAPKVRATLKAKSAQLCDGLGAGRIAEAILAL